MRTSQAFFAPGLLNASLARLRNDLSRLLIINLICGLVVKYAMHYRGSFLESMVYSNFIGFSIYTLCRVTSYLLWRSATAPHIIWMLGLSLLLSPVGFAIGITLGSWVYAYPISFSIITSLIASPPFLTLTGVTSLVAIWAFWNKSRMAELEAAAATEKARSEATEKQAMQAQLQLLQAQIEPHMLFNTLANLQGLIALDPERAQHMLAQLIVFLRATLGSVRAGQTTLAHEFELISAYLDLLKIRMGRRLEFTLDLPAELRGYSIAPMLLQPLVENAIKHGLEPKIEGGALHVRARQEADCVVLQVSDTGLGLDSAYVNAHSTQLGNANLRARLLALHGERASFTLTTNTPTGAIAELKLPLYLS